MHDDVIAAAREAIRRVDAAEQQRRFEEEQASTWEFPTSPLSGEPVADWRRCRTTAEMTSAQFNQYCRDGMPPLEKPKPVPQPKRKPALQRSTATDALAAVRDLRKEARELADDIGAVTGGLERKLNELVAEVGQLRAELQQKALADADGPLDLSSSSWRDWSSDARH